MAYGTEFTVGSKSRLMRWSHHQRFYAAIDAADIPEGARVLDYGTGDGHMLRLAREAEPSAELWGFEPAYAAEARKTLGDTATITDDTAALPSNHFDVVYCLEVLEHLRPDLLDKAVSEIFRVAKPGAAIVISVPIEVHATAIFKNAMRIVFRKRHRGGLKAELLAVFGLNHKIQRTERNNYISSHLGFDYRRLPPKLERHGLRVDKRAFSPVPALGGLLNSQVTYRLSKEPPISGSISGSMRPEPVREVA